MKYCPKCHKTKNNADFNKNRSTPAGLQSWCRLCSIKHNRKPSTKAGKKLATEKRKKKEQWEKDVITPSEAAEVMERNLSIKKPLITPDDLKPVYLCLLNGVVIGDHEPVGINAIEDFIDDYLMESHTADPDLLEFSIYKVELMRHTLTPKFVLDLIDERVMSNE